MAKESFNFLGHAQAWIKQLHEWCLSHLKNLETDYEDQIKNATTLLNSSIATETDRAKIVEGALESRIATEEKRAIGVEKSLESRIATEEERSTFVDNNNSNALTFLTNTLNEHISDGTIHGGTGTDDGDTHAHPYVPIVDSNFPNTVMVRDSNGLAISSDVTPNELFHLKGAKSNIQQQIINLEVDYETQITDERVRAEGVESWLEDRITDETTRATGIESGLREELDDAKEIIATINGDVSTAGSFAKAVADEETRAKEAEQSLENKIDLYKSELDKTDTDHNDRINALYEYARGEADRMTQHIFDTTVHITADERATWNAKSDAHNHPYVPLVNDTKDAVLIRDSTGTCVGSEISSLELNCLDGCTKNIPSEITRLDTHISRLDIVDANLHSGIIANTSLINENADVCAKHRLDTTIHFTMEDVKTLLNNKIGYYDWSKVVPIRVKIDGSREIKYDSTIAAITKKVTLNEDTKFAITIGKPIDTVKDPKDDTKVLDLPSLIGSGTTYVRLLTAHMRGILTISDGANNCALLRSESTTWVKCYVGGSLHVASIQLELFPDDQVMVIAGNSIDSTNDPYIIQFIPWISLIQE